MSQNNTYKPIPDWKKPKALVLVWPGGVHRKYLLRFYAYFTSYFPDDIKLIYLVKNAWIEKEVKDFVRKYNKKINILCLIIPEVDDIWIRDWGPIPAVDSTGKTVAIKAIYKPRYLSKSATYKARAFADDIAGRKLAALLGLPAIDIPLIWDIGNLTHNGEGTAIVTNRLIDDNKDTFTESQIRALLRETLNIIRLIILPEESEDETGHIDGMVRFLDPKTVAVGAYPRINSTAISL
jgi:agmatine deiminase